jgi:hypothetical protein
VPVILCKSELLISWTLPGLKTVFICNKCVAPETVY